MAVFSSVHIADFSSTFFSTAEKLSSREIAPPRTLVIFPASARIFRSLLTVDADTSSILQSSAIVTLFRVFTVSVIME